MLFRQVDAIRFMFRNCLQSVDKVASGADGRGCIVAHSMGLGKTLSAIAFLHTVLTNEVRSPTPLGNGASHAALGVGRWARALGFAARTGPRELARTRRCFARTFAE
jgi:hypothetical protein